MDAIQYPLFNQELYPTIVEKAAVLSWAISANYVFFDGNNRTAGSVLLILLAVNGYQLNSTHDELVAIMMEISADENNEYTLQQYTEWLRGRLALGRMLTTR